MEGDVVFAGLVHGDLLGQDDRLGRDGLYRCLGDERGGKVLDGVATAHQHLHFLLVA